MKPLTPAELRLLDSVDHGVLATEATDGKPRQSVVYFARDAETLLVSTLTGRAKTRDVTRSGWASLSVSGQDRPHPSATFSGPAEIRTDGIGPATAEVMRRITGTAETPESMSDEALADAGRVILAIRIARVSAAAHLEE